MKRFLTAILLLLSFKCYGQVTPSAGIQKFTGELLGQGEITFTELSTPATPTVTNAGAAGTTSWSYKVVAKLISGTTPASSAGTTATGNATLDGTNYNIISWNIVRGAKQYQIYRTAAGGTPSTTGLIATVNAPTLTYSDQGAAGDSSTAPTESSTGAIYGSKLSNGDLYLYGTQHATKTTSNVLLQPTGGNVGIGLASTLVSPDQKLQVEGGNIEVLNVSTLGSESLTNPNLTSGTAWAAANDCTLAANAATWAYSAGTASTLTQTSASLAVAGAANRWYKFTYTVSAITGTPAANITTGFASAATSLTISTGSQTLYFKSAASPGDFVITSTLTAGQAFTLDTFSLKEVQGGNVIANGLFTGGGTTGIKVLGSGNVGIGTTTPSAKLEVNGSIAILGYNFFRMGGTDVMQRDSVSFNFWGGPYIFNSNNVGIGVTSPSQKLEVWDGSANIVDPATLGSESLTNPNLTSGTSWTATNDCALAADAATWTFSAGTASTLTQASATLAIAGVQNRWYKFTYTVSGITGTPTASITTAFANTSTALTITAGSQTLYFKSATSPGNFVITSTLTSGQAFTLDTFSLKEVQGGNVTANGLFTGGGTVGIKVSGKGYVGLGGVTVPATLLDVQRSTAGEALAYFNQTSATGNGININSASSSASYYLANMTNASSDVVFKALADGTFQSTGVEGKLATVTGINAKTVAATTLYTVPTGKTCIVTKVVTRCTAADTVAGVASVSFGGEAVTFADMKGITALTGLDAVNEMFIATSDNVTRPVYAAGTTFSINVTTGATATSQTLACDVWGYVF